MRGYLRKALLGCVIGGILLVSVPVIAGEGYKTAGDYVTEAKAVVEQITVEQAYQDYFKPGEADVVFLDVREADEVEAGHIPGSMWIARGLLEFKIAGMFPEVDAQTIIVLCKTGGRSALAAKILQEMGYQVISMDGGFLGWQEEGYPVRRGAIISSEGGCG